MEHTLLKLKRLLNSIDDEELKDIDLWVDNSKSIDVIALDENAITLITDDNLLKIDERDW